MIAWFAKNHVAANLLLITILIGGLFSLSVRIPLEVFPSFATDRINVTVSLRGATPDDNIEIVTIMMFTGQPLCGLAMLSREQIIFCLLLIFETIN